MLAANLTRRSFGARYILGGVAVGLFEGTFLSVISSSEPKPLKRLSVALRGQHGQRLSPPSQAREEHQDFCHYGCLTRTNSNLGLRRCPGP